MYVYGCDVLALHVIFYWFAACRMGCCGHYVFDLSISLCVCVHAYVCAYMGVWRLSLTGLHSLLVLSV